MVVGEACTAVGLSRDLTWVAEARRRCVVADFGDPSWWRGEPKEVVVAVPVWLTGTFQGGSRSPPWRAVTIHGVLSRRSWSCLDLLPTFTCV